MIVSSDVAVLIDGNNIEMSLHDWLGDKQAMLNFKQAIPRIVGDRQLKRLIYFREGRTISEKLGELLREEFMGSVIPCNKSADIPLTIKAVQLASKVDTIIIFSGDADYIELVAYLRNEGIRVESASVEHSTSRDLISVVDHHHPIIRDDVFIYSSRNSSIFRK